MVQLNRIFRRLKTESRLFRDLRTCHRNPQSPKPPETPRLRKITAGRHTVFYLATDSEVETVRIMHQQQDHLGGLGLV